MSKSWDIQDGIPVIPSSIVGFVADLLFSSRIEEAANRLDFKMYWIERADQLALSEREKPKFQRELWDEYPTEKLSGIEGALLEKIIQLQPALIIFDLGNQAIPWRKWLPLIKSAPATRRIPVLCYGSHVDIETMQYAHSAGADAVVARSRLMSDLQGLITKYARVPDYAGLVQPCAEKLSPTAIIGLEEFNRGAYFEAHEHLEAAWKEDQTPGRELYRVIVQISVAYLQIERKNYRGAMKIFMRVRQWIDPLPSLCRGVDVDSLRSDIERARAELIRLGPDRIQEFEHKLFQPVHYENAG